MPILQLPANNKLQQAVPILQLPANNKLQQTAHPAAASQQQTAAGCAHPAAASQHYTDTVCVAYCRPISKRWETTVICTRKPHDPSIITRPNWWHTPSLHPLWCQVIPCFMLIDSVTPILYIPYHVRWYCHFML